jgi:hypothetical protein
LRKLLLALPAVALLATACFAGDGGDETPEPTATGGEEDTEVLGVDLSIHSVPLEEIHFDTFGGSIPLTGISAVQVNALRDAIPPLDKPNYDDVTGGAWLDASDLVLGYESASGGAWAYPLKILNFHEIVNDELDGVPVLITYCPLCRSGIAYDRRLDGGVLTFGNTNALYESDLVMFDRETNSYWWQTAGEAIVGTLTGKRLDTLPAVTTTWGEWSKLHPDTRVLSRDTGFIRPYETDRFAGYQDIVNSGQFPFPVSDASRDARLPPADEVLGVVVGGESVAYPLRILGDAAVNDTISGTSVVIFSKADGPSGGAFRAEVGGRALTFRFEGGGYVDEETGSVWDLSGQAVSGSLQGERLEPFPARYTFWFAYIAAFPDTELFVP